MTKKNPSRKYKPVAQPPDGPGPWHRDTFPADTPNGRKAIAKFFTRDGRRIIDYRTFRVSIEEVFATANDDLSLPNTEQRNQIRAAISELHKNLEIAGLHLADLSGLSMAHLKSAAKKRVKRSPGRTRRWMGKKVGEDVNGYIAVERAKDALLDLTLWSEDASKRISANGTKRANATAPQIANSLAEIWLEQTGEFPPSTTDVSSGHKGSDFYELCDHAFHQLWARVEQGNTPRSTTYAPGAIAKVKASLE